MREADTVILSVPFRNHSETLTNLKEALSPGKLLIDATVPLAAAVSGKATRMLGVWQGSAAEQALEMAPQGVRVVSALHTVSAASLTDLEHPLGQDVLICGDARADKADAAALIERIDGLRCVDCGRLEMARIAESLTALLISVNARYKIHSGIRLTSLPERLWDVSSARGASSSPAGPAEQSSRGGWPTRLVPRAPSGDRQHGRRHRDLRRPRLARPRPGVLLACRPDRRARLGPVAATPST